MKNNKIPPAIIQEIKSRNNLVEIINEYSSVNRHLKASCPFHEDKTPSLSVHPSLKFWKCFSCDQKGDVISFFQEINKLSFYDTVSVLAHKVGIGLDTSDRFQVYLKRKIDARKKGLQTVSLVRAFLRKIEINFYDVMRKKRWDLYKKTDPIFWNKRDYLCQQMIDYRIDCFDNQMSNFISEIERREKNG